MSGYSQYGGGYDGINMNNMNSSNDNSGNGMMMGSSGIGSGSIQGQSLDDIVDQNAKAIRRQSAPQAHGYGNVSQGDMNMDMAVMMEFSGGSPPGPLQNFNFEPSTSLGQDDLNNMAAQMSGPSRHPSLKKHISAANLQTLNSPYGGSSAYSNMAQPDSTYQSPAHGGTFDMDMNSPYLANPMSLSMDFTNEPNTFDNMMSMSPNHMNMYNQMSYNSSMMGTPMSTGGMGNGQQGQSLDANTSSSRTSLAGIDGMQRGISAVGSDGRRSTYGGPEPQRRPSLGSKQQSSRSQSLQMPNQNQRSGSQSTHSQNPRPANLQHQNSSTAEGRGGFDAQPQNPARGSAQDKPVGGSHSGPPHSDNALPRGFDTAQYNPNNQNFPWQEPEGGWPSTMIQKPHMQSSYKNVYSSTGFDMLQVLMRVATRPNPQIDLGSVDLSCAFVVCDAEKDDFPIVYCSDNFERLTGYTRHMILGRNCRFLQSPDGNVAPGVKRKYVDDESVLYLKNMVNARREAQISLINYRRGGQPFMNLLTMIPVAMDTDQVKFFVGFQVDLVEQPNAVTNRNSDGTYTVNYQRGMTMPRYVLNAPESTPRPAMGQTIPRDDVSAILSTIGTGESEYAKRMWDKVLLENTDDLVHVLSLKGLFQWVSPSSVKILEYEPSELIGTALSSVCHPSDIVPVTRELKDTSSGASVNIVFRIRRKHSGYMWFEGHGSLHTEQGKGRKSIIMVGRERPVYTLSKTDVLGNGGIGEYELWTKLSTSGMFLFVSSNVRQLLDRQPEELIGVSIQSLMRADSKKDFARILEHARTGKKASVKHEVINRRGQVLQAYTTLYPGDATEGLKPTFVVAQTRLIKYSRSTANRQNELRKEARAGSESVQSSSSKPAQPRTDQNGRDGGATPQTPQHVSTESYAMTYAGQNGLQIGHQDESLASEDNLFDELKTTKSSSWQYEIRQLEKKNRILAEEVQAQLAAKKKRKRRKGAGPMQKDCANCHTRVTPEWRRGPSGQRDLCNSCGLRWAKLNGRVSPRTSSQQSKQSGDAASDRASKASASPMHIKQELGNVPSSLPQQHSSDPSRSQSAPSRETQISPPVREGGHAAQMEGASGVPDRIDEGNEPE